MSEAVDMNDPREAPQSASRELLSTSEPGTPEGGTPGLRTVAANHMRCKTTLGME